MRWRSKSGGMYSPRMHVAGDDEPQQRDVDEHVLEIRLRRPHFGRDAGTHRIAFTHGLLDDRLRHGGGNLVAVSLDCADDPRGDGPATALQQQASADEDYRDFS